MWCGGVLSRKGRFESLSGRECERWETSPGTGHPLKVPFPGSMGYGFRLASQPTQPTLHFEQPSSPAEASSGVLGSMCVELAFLLTLNGTRPV